MPEIVGSPAWLERRRKLLQAHPCERCGGRGTVRVQFLPTYDTDSGSEREDAHRDAKCPDCRNFARTEFTLALAAIEELTQENSEMARQLAEPPESAVRIAELAAALDSKMGRISELEATVKAREERLDQMERVSVAAAKRIEGLERQNSALMASFGSPEGIPAEHLIGIGKGLRDVELGLTIPLEVVQNRTPYEFILASDKQALTERIAELKRQLAVAARELISYEASYGSGGGDDSACVIAELLGYDDAREIERVDCWLQEFAARKEQE